MNKFVNIAKFELQKVIKNKLKGFLISRGNLARLKF